MKLKKLLDVLDPMCKIVIWSMDSSVDEDEDDEPLFKGYIADVPYSLVKYPIFVDNEFEDIAVRASENAIILTIDDTVED